MRMRKTTKFKLCNWILLCLSFAILISGLQLEIMHGKPTLSVWLHIGIGFLFFVGITWHIYLHFGWNRWLYKFKKPKKPAIRILAIVSCITLFSAILATIHWLNHFNHNSIGGVHGKIGYIMLILLLGHILKRKKYFG